MKVACATLVDDLLETLGGGLGAEVLHLDLSVVGHLGLKLLLAADLDRTHGDLERLAVAAHRLDNLHEALAQHAGADLFLQLGIEFESFHGHMISKVR